MVTTDHKRVSTTGGKYRNYISYFQSVTTIGIISRAKNSIEAEAKAKVKLKNSDFMCGVVGQTPFDLHATDEWIPKKPELELEPEQEEEKEVKSVMEKCAHNNFTRKKEMGLWFNECKDCGSALFDGKGQEWNQPNRR